MIWVILGIVGSVLLATECYRRWKVSNIGHTKLILKSIGVGLGMLATLALILFIAWN
jgi:hypothetical protein